MSSSDKADIVFVQGKCRLGSEAFYLQSFNNTNKTKEKVFFK